MGHAASLCAMADQMAMAFGECQIEARWQNKPIHVQRRQVPCEYGHSGMLKIPYQGKSHADVTVDLCWQLALQAERQFPGKLGDEHSVLRYVCQRIYLGVSLAVMRHKGCFWKQGRQ